MAMAARVPAADVNLYPSSPFAASLCHRPGDAALHAPPRVPSRTPRRLEESNRIICRAAEEQGAGGARRTRREPLRRGAVSARLPVPDHIPRPPYVGADAIPDVCPDRQVHDGESIMRMLDACELAARVLQYAGTLVKPAVTTDEIDRAAHQMIVDAGAYPSPLGYGGFPKSVCTSVNECTCHGIPDSRELQDGDIINIDVTVYLNGYHGDTSRTYLCGDVDEPTKQLVKVTEECMMRGISACRHGASFKEIGQRISDGSAWVVLVSTRRSMDTASTPSLGMALGGYSIVNPSYGAHTITSRVSWSQARHSPSSQRCRWGAPSACCGTTAGRRWRRTAASARSSSTPCWSPATAWRSSRAVRSGI
ncbi:methionine aminopeptidase 1B, chloroplastic-like isoform X1 [Panicum virgatum]|uniref:methionine aminopeptidase 1B, chloroplastic-like isoform X1 n=1 Tax=Panicum virgatum TaxID=38727 RepID=UPI0019D6270E|nr:methionine aminopeptidase 1B, chloroplastic-like isoform X1 [Panicum virgatum]